MHVHGNASEQKYENFTLHLKSETSLISLIRYQKVHKFFKGFPHPSVSGTHY